MVRQALKSASAVRSDSPTHYFSLDLKSVLSTLQGADNLGLSASLTLLRRLAGCLDAKPLLSLLLASRPQEQHFDTQVSISGRLVSVATRVPTSGVTFLGHHFQVHNLSPSLSLRSRILRIIPSHDSTAGPKSTGRDYGNYRPPSSAAIDEDSLRFNVHGRPVEQAGYVYSTLLRSSIESPSRTRLLPEDLPQDVAVQYADGSSAKNRTSRTVTLTICCSEYCVPDVKLFIIPLTTYRIFSASLGSFDSVSASTSCIFASASMFTANPWNKPTTKSTFRIPTNAQFEPLLLHRQQGLWPRLQALYNLLLISRALLYPRSKRMRRSTSSVLTSVLQLLLKPHLPARTPTSVSTLVLYLNQLYSLLCSLSLDLRCTLPRCLDLDSKSLLISRLPSQPTLRY
ncbi:hypothetical protein A4X13_0g9034 [Tilletia indica]|uniref:Uncharacterized protein n=1 Tax=Tilletia indica TaxID=43049 RepID=A0A8T8SC55_9BASI|nr:hypothetical protein A4X13_0g9034 [Tilletia indica]